MDIKLDSLVKKIQEVNVSFMKTFNENDFCISQLLMRHS